MKIFVIFLILLIHAASCAISNQLLNSMKEQAEKIATTMPKDASSLVNDIKANALDGYDQCSESDFDEMMKKYNFSSSITKQFQMITIAESIEFQAFQVTLNNKYNDIQEFIGAGLKYQGIIKIAFLQAFAEGTPVPQYESYRCCHSCWLVGSCCDTCHRQIGMTSAQLNEITEALRATAYGKITNFLNNPPEKFSNYTKQQQQLQDQNKWDVLMSQYNKCDLLKKQDCFESYTKGVDFCKQYDSNKDELMECLLKTMNIKSKSNLLPCYLCICGAFNKNSSYPKTQKFCYDNYFELIQSAVQDQDYLF